MVETAERKAFGDGLQKLNENMATMAELSELAIRKAVEGLEKQVDSETDQVYALDQEIYGLMQQVMASCVDLIALYAPVARDLRTITTSLEIATDLDRIGRYAKDIAEITDDLHESHPEVLESLPQIRKMLEVTIQMVDTSVRAFLSRDAEPVRNIIRDDDAVDALHDEVFQLLVDRMANRSLAVSLGAQYILVNRYLERIADHAVNIGQHVIYMMTGQRTPRAIGGRAASPGPAPPAPRG
jgi:phosphate transport system protein